MRMIDRVADRLCGGQLIMIAGRPAMGKTEVAIRMIDHMCVRGGRSALVFSNRVSCYEYMHRLISTESGVSMDRFRNFAFSESELGRVRESAKRVENTVIAVNYSSSRSISDIRDYLQDFPGKPVLVIDDLEQMHRERGPGRLYDGGLRKLKALAVEYDIPIVVLADLSRACERRKDHRPRISDIRHVRDTSAIDLIMMLHSEGYYAESYGSRIDDLELIVEDRRKTV